MNSLSVTLIILLLCNISFMKVNAETKLETPLTENILFSSHTEAYRQGMSGFHANRMDIALPALEYAAKGELHQAQLWLARIYLYGLKGASQDHLKAFKYYQLLADSLAEIHPFSPFAKVSSEAFVTLGNYYSIGIPGFKEPNDEEAVRMYHHAASYFQDPYGQYYLAMMYLKGNGVQKNTQRAVRWLLNAARKNHPGSQAVLGEILWLGQDFKQNKAKGLAFLKLAKRNVVSKNNQWILNLYQKISGQANRQVQGQANQLVKRWDDRFGSERIVVGDNITPYGRDYIEPSLNSSGPRFRPVGARMFGTR
ncbi:MAG: tetratricopeptide repeat protein [Pseudomonadota bacterium]